MQYGVNDLVKEQELMDMLVVPEEMVELCSTTMVSAFGDEGLDNNFKTVLNKGEIFKNAGLTPVYLCSQDMKTICVTSVEKIKNTFH
jgi:hypothetical protein